MVEESVEVLVIGAGPSGCVSAAYLKNNNINVKIVEKSKFPRYVIGESLLPRCILDIVRLAKGELGSEHELGQERVLRPKDELADYRWLETRVVLVGR